jgi:transposase-like protein
VVNILTQTIIRERLLAVAQVEAVNLAGLASYIDLLTKWNRKINLTSFDVDPVTDIAIDRLIIEPAMASSFIVNPDITVIDLGSGGGSPWAGKAAVMGLLQRTTEKKKSQVKLEVVPSTRRHQLMARIEKHVEDGSAVYTDALKSYNNLGAYYQHQVIDHGECYAKGQVHTNGMENFWSLLKRSIKGTYVSVEPFHLFRYLDEQAFRFNGRAGNDSERFEQTTKQIVGRRVTYKELTGKEAIA